MEKVELDHRSLYAGNVSPGGGKMGPLQWVSRVGHLLLALRIKERSHRPRRGEARGQDLTGGWAAQDGTWGLCPQAFWCPDRNHSMGSLQLANHCGHKSHFKKAHVVWAGQMNLGGRLPHAEHTSRSPVHPQQG